ncbi:phosphotransferase enzyme family protein [Maribacter antarcticus]|uniref:phosphotransferase enzyme family protein n=1 Tax=Maribacter antarcticus TaxID=505250 RepID=UPI0006877F08|nr:aminoglycoside phosphotransferase family protein [Maribacter antarcticus]
MELTNSTYTSEDLQELLGCFVVEKQQFRFQPLTAGLINETFLVCNEDQPMYVLQRINHAVFPDVSGLMKNVSGALKVLNERDYSEIRLLKTRDGSYFIKVTSGYWRLMSFIVDSTTYNTTEKEETAFEAGRIIGNFHLLLEDQNLLEYTDTIRRFHDLSLREQQFKSALATADTFKLETAHAHIAFAKETLNTLKDIQLDGLKLRVCHNDTKLNNILFSKQTGKGLCLIDLDTIMKGYFFYDFGDAIRTVVNTAPEDEKQLSHICFKDYLFTSFVEGLASNPSFLSEEELESLPMGAVFMPFIHGLRALTDYLENNRYYKVTYQNQNLDRCISLFDFSKKALDKIPFMETELKRLFSASL